MSLDNKIPHYVIFSIKSWRNQFLEQHPEKRTSVKNYDAYLPSEFNSDTNLRDNSTAQSSTSTVQDPALSDTIVAPTVEVLMELNQKVQTCNFL